jgi:hypothetical protein
MMLQENFRRWWIIDVVHLIFVPLLQGNEIFHVIMKVIIMHLA